MNEVKSFLESKTIWGALIALIPTLTTVLGFDMGVTVNDVVTIAGLVFVIYGRVVASKKIG